MSQEEFLDQARKSWSRLTTNSEDRLHDLKEYGAQTAVVIAYIDECCSEEYCKPNIPLIRLELGDDCCMWFLNGNFHCIH